MTDLYADRLGNITIANGVARLDFLRLTSVDTEKQQASMAPSFRLVLPVDGMIQTLEALDKVRNDLQKQIKERESGVSVSMPKP